MRINPPRPFSEAYRPSAAASRPGWWAMIIERIFSSVVMTLSRSSAYCCTGSTAGGAGAGDDAEEEGEGGPLGAVQPASAGTPRSSASDITALRRRRAGIRCLRL
jgi:hypothetical protein